MKETLIGGVVNRVLQLVAGKAPGAKSLRVRLHRWRGVRIGSNVWVGYDSIIETGFPNLVSIGNNSVIGMRVVIIAHFRGMESSSNPDGTTVVVEDEVFIGPGCIILPNVRIGRGSVVCAGSVVTRDVPPMTMVRGNPAVPVAHCGVPLTMGTSKAQFAKHRTPITSKLNP
jgi:acetyltransferase-like isoleucine patch superfamily enzyme